MIKFILTCIAISGIFTLDIYLPGVPEQIKSLNVSSTAISWTFTIFSITFAISQLIVGPLSDKYGRKPILIIGLFLATVSTFLCGLASGFWELLTFRILQAVGASCFVVMHAIIRDLHDGPIATRLRGYSTMIAGVIISVAPSLGSFLVYISGWRGTFILSSGVFLLTFVFIVFFFKETNTSNSINSKNIINNYYTLVRYNPSYMKRNIQYALGYSVHFCFVIMSSYIIVIQMHYNLFVYSFFMVLYGLMLFASGVVTNKLSIKYHNAQIIVIGTIIMLTSALLLLVLSITNNSNIYIFSILILIMIAGGTITRPCSLTLALSSIPGLSGQGAAGASLLQFLLSGVIASIMSVFSMHIVDIICIYTMLASFMILIINKGKPILILK
ncbi:MFS transporter [Francisella sp. SYW-9]|uniref:MFS transporter n=1 Tax=Francisella sp. SYW-9 TaxID=2610888 RepID=UPI00123DC3AE|nr:MFS transporter [Francisella sp. SYW-9]